MFVTVHRYNAASKKRGDWKGIFESTGRRFTLLSATSDRGFSLIELVITVTVLSILTIGVIPMVKVACKTSKRAAVARRASPNEICH
jgi:prepilin-type N-terminal cleavage/methylation domain-containing protein